MSRRTWYCIGFITGMMGGLCFKPYPIAAFIIMMSFPIILNAVFDRGWR